MGFLRSLYQWEQGHSWGEWCDRPERQGENFRRKKMEKISALTCIQFSITEPNKRKFQECHNRTYSHIRIQFYYNSNCCLDTCATCFDLYLGHFQARQYKNFTKRNVIKFLSGPMLTVAIFNVKT